MTEAAPLAATALLPLVLFPILDIRSIDATAGSFAHPLIFLFLGGFLLARTMNVWKLDRRLALTVLRYSGDNPRIIIGALMGVTAFLSMWVSNTATSMVMLPIAMSVAATLSQPGSKKEEDPAPAMLLAIAYAATIGGMGTIIGTPPNALFAAFMADSYGIEISFVRWMMIGVPLVLILLPITWLILTRVTFRISDRASLQTSGVIEEELAALGPFSRAERLLTIIMVVVAMGWIFRSLLVEVLPWLRLSDAGIAVAGALLVFIVPTGFRRGRFLLRWEEAMDIRWDVLILFGGGLALAAAMSNSDLAGWIGDQLTNLGTLPIFLLLLSIGVLIVFVGELASNTAMAAVFLPVAGATALGLGEPAIMLTLPVALFATLGFMLPVATPPNAIIFGSGAVEQRDMIRAGIILDFVGIVIVALAIMLLGELVITPS
ncbi:MAG: DASS family sodium-coupled anion symporter [Rhodospirillaceae bacterium]|jgi:solute carrier family 13 (sodium-dependent dicarboxylate transporter), member 2/3/5|nr:DASS family sodium-coupled anion symporter [Rhodospirillaceae bacterium]